MSKHATADDEIERSMQLEEKQLAWLHGPRPNLPHAEPQAEPDGGAKEGVHEE